MPISGKGVDTFNELFNIRTNEWPRLLLLLLIAALTNLGAIWGISIIYAALLQEIGLQALPWILVASSILSIIAAAIYAAFVDRLANERLLIIIFALGAGSIIVGLILLWLDLSLLAYPWLYLLSLALIAVLNPHQITYFNSFYDTQAAKRVLPLVSAGYRLGAIVAGLTMPLLNRGLGSAKIIGLWLLIYLFSALLVRLMPFLLNENVIANDRLDYVRPNSPAGPTDRRYAYLANMREGFHHTVRSIYLRWMAISMLLMMILMALLEYRSGQLLLEGFGTVEELADFVGFLVGTANIVALPILLFGMSRLLAQVGVSNASLLFPTGNLIVCAGLLFSPGLVTASAAFLNRTTFRLAFFSPIEGLLSNAVSVRIKGRARAFVSGLIVPVGSLLGGLLLLLPVTSMAGFLPGLIAGLALAYLAASLIVRNLYSQTLIKMLEQEDFSWLLLQNDSTLPSAGPAALALLQKKLIESPGHEFTVFMAQLIGQVGGKRVVSILGQAAKNSEAARTRAAILDVLTATDPRGPAARQLYLDFLADPNGPVRQSAVAGLERLAGSANEDFLRAALKITTDPELDVRVRVLSALALRVRREPLIALARQYPDVSLELIQVLSQQLRKAYDGRAEFIRNRST